MSVCRSRTHIAPAPRLEAGSIQGSNEDTCLPPSHPPRTAGPIREGPGVVDALGASILVLGVIVLIAAFSTTNASAVNNEFLPSGTATTTLSCTGNDAVDGGLTTTILDGIGLNPVGLSATITSDPSTAPTPVTRSR